MRARNIKFILRSFFILVTIDIVKIENKIDDEEERKFCSRTIAIAINEVDIITSLEMHRFRDKTNVHVRSVIVNLFR